MTSDPDAIRRQIEGTRRELSADVNALTEKVTPSRVVARRVDRTRNALTDMKDRIMGSAESATSTMSDTASSAGYGVSSAASGAADRVSSAASTAASTTADVVTSAPRAVRRRTEGNPLAAGLVAFGLGWLISSLLPATRKEQELAAQAKDAVSDRMQPVTDRLQEAAYEVKENLREPAQQAVESVKATASGAASTVADESRVAADHVTSRTEDARENLKNGVRT